MDTVEHQTNADNPKLVRRRSPRSINGTHRTPLRVWLTPNERALLEQQAQNSRQSLSRVLVNAALHSVNPDTVTNSEVVQLIDELGYYRRQLSGIATNINQMAHHANATQEFPRNANTALTQVATCINAIDSITKKVTA